MRPLPAIPIAQLGGAKAATPGGKLEILPCATGPGPPGDQVTEQLKG
jgi:hypothetical protein